VKEIQVTINQANPIHQGNQGSDSLGWEINEYKIE